MMMMACRQIGGPFDQHWLTLIPALISNCIHNKARDEIIHPFPNINGLAVEVWEWIINHLFMLGFKLTHLSKWGPMRKATN